MFAEMFDKVTKKIKEATSKASGNTDTQDSQSSNSQSTTKSEKDIQASKTVENKTSNLTGAGEKSPTFSASNRLQKLKKDLVSGIFKRRQLENIFADSDDGLGVAEQIESLNSVYDESGRNKEATQPISFGIEVKRGTKAKVQNPESTKVYSDQARKTTQSGSASSNLNSNSASNLASNSTSKTTFNSDSNREELLNKVDTAQLKAKIRAVEADLDKHQNPTTPTARLAAEQKKASQQTKDKVAEVSAKNSDKRLGKAPSSGKKATPAKNVKQISTSSGLVFAVRSTKNTPALTDTKPATPSAKSTGATSTSATTSTSKANAGNYPVLHRSQSLSLATTTPATSSSGYAGSASSVSSSNNLQQPQVEEFVDLTYDVQQKQGSKGESFGIVTSSKVYQGTRAEVESGSGLTANQTHKVNPGNSGNQLVTVRGAKGNQISEVSESKTEVHQSQVNPKKPKIKSYVYKSTQTRTITHTTNEVGEESIEVTDAIETKVIRSHNLSADQRQTQVSTQKNSRSTSISKDNIGEEAFAKLVNEMLGGEEFIQEAARELAPANPELNHPVAISNQGNIPSSSFETGSSFASSTAPLTNSGRDFGGENAESFAELFANGNPEQGAELTRDTSTSITSNSGNSGSRSSGPSNSNKRKKIIGYQGHKHKHASESDAQMQLVESASQVSSAGLSSTPGSKPSLPSKPVTSEPSFAQMFEASGFTGYDADPEMEGHKGVTNARSKSKVSLNSSKSSSVKADAESFASLFGVSGQGIADKDASAQSNLQRQQQNQAAKRSKMMLPGSNPASSSARSGVKATANTGAKTSAKTSSNSASGYGTFAQEFAGDNPRIFNIEEALVNDREFREYYLVDEAEPSFAEQFEAQVKPTSSPTRVETTPDWAAELGDVKPLAGNNFGVSLEQQRRRAIQQQRSQAQLMSGKQLLELEMQEAESRRNKMQGVDFISDISLRFGEVDYEEASYLSTEFDKELFYNLRNGLYDIDLMVDLHGLTKEEAKTHITQAIREALKNDESVILFISGHGKDILKQALPNWLIQISKVAAFVPYKDASRRTNGYKVLLKNFSKEYFIGRL